MNFADKIKEFRNENSLTQNELAEKLDISRTQLAMIETGKRPVTKAVINKLVEISGRSLKSWLDNTEYDESSYKEMTALSMLLDYMIDKGIIKTIDDVDNETEHIMKIVKEEVKIKLKNTQKFNELHQK